MIPGKKDKHLLGETYFPRDLPAQDWISFPARGFDALVTGVIHKRSYPAVSGMPLGGIDTGCIDLETGGTFGYNTIFNRHVPRGGPLNMPFLGLSIGDRSADNHTTWVLTTGQTKVYEDTALNLHRMTRHETTTWAKPGHTAPDLSLTGVEKAEDIHYWGHYPVADLEYEIGAPVQVGMRAWTPFIPGDIEYSAIPAVVFEVELRNPESGSQSGCVLFSFPGPDAAEAGSDAWKHLPVHEDGFKGVQVKTPKSSYVLGVINQQVRTGGGLGVNGTVWAESPQQLPSAVDGSAALAVDFNLKAGETLKLHFILAWYSPQWKGGGTPDAKGNTYTHMAATWYKDPLETAMKMVREHHQILARVLAWQEAIFTADDIPGWLQDSLINIFHLIAEDGLWAAKESQSPLGDWVQKEDGLFGLDECPRGCPQIECIPCSFYGNIPLVLFYPRLAISTARAYHAYQYEEGASPWIFSCAVDGKADSDKTLSCELVLPTRGFREGLGSQRTLNGPCYVDMVNRLWLASGDDSIVEEFYQSIKLSTQYTMGLRSDGEMGDRIISMPDGNKDTTWFEAPEPGWYGMVTHIGGIHLANLLMAEKMAIKMGDEDFARQCREWFDLGSQAMEEKMWVDGYYLNFWDPETGERSDMIFGYQLDGEWMAKFHGLESVFRKDRIDETLETIRNINASLTQHGAVNYANPDGSAATVGGYGPYSMFPPEVLMLAMTYMYHGEKDFGLELAYRCWRNITCGHGLAWDQPNIFRGDEDTGERIFGADYYQNMMLWALPLVLEGRYMGGAMEPEGLVARVLRAGQPQGVD